MLVKLFRKLFFRNSARGAPRVRRAFPTLEPLEARELLATFLWTGTADGTDFNWSTKANWLVGGFQPPAPPGPNDEVKFDNNIPVPNKSVVDAGFTGTVHDLTILGTYTNTITLNHSLSVIGGTASIGGGKISGAAGVLTIGDNPPVGPYQPGTLIWTGGTINLTNGSGLILGPGGNGSISGTAVKTLDGSKFFNMSPNLSWDGVHLRYCSCARGMR